MGFRRRAREGLRYSNADLTPENVAMWKEIGLPYRLNMDIARSTPLPIVPYEEVLYCSRGPMSKHRCFTISVHNNVKNRVVEVWIRRYYWYNILKQEEGHYKWVEYKSHKISMNHAGKWLFGVNKLLSINSEVAHKRVGTVYYILRYGKQDNEGTYHHNWFFRVGADGVFSKRNTRDLNYEISCITQNGRLWFNIKSMVDKPLALYALRDALTRSCNAMHDMLLPTPETEEECIDDN